MGTRTLEQQIGIPLGTVGLSPSGRGSIQRTDRKDMLISLPLQRFFSDRMLLLGLRAVMISLVVGAQARAETLPAEPVIFRSDDAEVSCRALLPQCFSREDWADLCRTVVNFQDDHQDSCDQALRADESCSSGQR